MTDAIRADHVYTVREAAQLIRISPRTYYQGAARGELPVTRIGRRLVVSGAQLARFLGGEVVDESTSRADNEGSRPREAFREP